MERSQIEKLILKANNLIAKFKAQDLVEVDEYEKQMESEGNIVEVTGGTYIRAWVFVPHEF